MSNAQAQIVRLYDTVFDRAPDPEGLAFWTNSLDQGYGLQTLAEHFMRAPEFAATYGQPTNRQFVESVYENVLDRPGDADGIAFWTAALDEGRAQRAETVIGFSESPEHQVQMSLPDPAPAPAAPPAQPAPAPVPVPPTPAPVEAAPPPSVPLFFSGTYRADHFVGGSGDDVALGFEDSDTLEGGAGNDRLVGFSEDDVLHGGPGNDTLAGSQGDDLLIGGPGDDLFLFDATRGADTIADFQRGDHIGVEAGRPVGPQFIATGAGGPLVLDVDAAHSGWNTVTFQGLTTADEGWVRDSFLFV